MFQITSVKFNHFPNTGITVALGSFTLNNAIQIAFALKQGQNGYFVDYGQDRKGKDGKWYKTVFVTDKTVHQAFIDILVQAFNAELAKHAQPAPVVQTTLPLQQQAQVLAAEVAPAKPKTTRRKKAAPAVEAQIPF